MKKLTLTCSIVVIAFCSLAQGISGGIKAGLNLANQKFSGVASSVDPKMKPGFLVGGFVTIMFSEHLGLQPEVLFAMQGTKFDYFGDDYQTNFNYLTIPILVRYNINDMINIHAGPQVGILLSAEYEYDGDTQDVKDDFKGTDISGVLGLGVDLPIGLGFGARYVQGFSQIAEDSDSDGEIKNSAIQIYLSYRVFGKDND